MIKIALDFDNVLSDTMKSWTAKYNAEHRTDYTKDHIREWDFWNQKEFGFDKPYADIFFRKSWEDWSSLQPIEKNLEQTVSNLAKFGTIDVVTNVDETHLIYVEKWLEHYNISINEVKHGGKEKIDLKYDLFIDDSPDLAKSAHSKKKKCFVYHQEWNKNVPENQNVTRIQNLTHAITQISQKGF